MKRRQDSPRGHNDLSVRRPSGRVVPRAARLRQCSGMSPERGAASDAFQDDLYRPGFEPIELIEVKMRAKRRMVSGQPEQVISERGETLCVTSNYRRVIVKASGQLVSGLPFEFHVCAAYRESEID